jgi:predicted TIM-barrel fold metal-dependent hydrolase
MGHFDPRRRRLVAGMAGWAAAGLSGCTMLKICETTISDRSLPLGIDVHSHVFNGTDLQIHEFFEKIVAEESDSEMRGIVAFLGAIIQELQWNGAPTAADELSRLQELKSIFASCDDRVQPLLSRLRDDTYGTGKRQILAARDRAQRKAAVSAQASRGLDEVLRPDSYDQFAARRDSVQKSRAPDVPFALPLTSNKTLTGVVDFILHGFYYRHSNVLEYLEKYSSGAARKIDLLVPSLVDFDWWLKQGAGTDSPLADQVAVMERISVLSGGRVHGFVPFCPFRETMTSKDGQPGDSMKLVQDAMGRGFIGVKLYPPMGFAPYGNTGRTVWRDHPEGLPKEALDPGFGKRLDDAMTRLLDWCRANDMPVMAHTNHSNGPNSAFEDLAGPDRWGDALGRFGGLRVNFGHFGDTDFGSDDGASLKKFVALMKMDGGRNAYADSAYFVNAMADPNGLRSALATLFADPQTSIAARRLMYGTDWEMILQEKGVDDYFANFQALVRPEVADGFFGRNAAAFLGLARGERNRMRLEAFYDRNAVSQPDWIAKVDKLS